MGFDVAYDPNQNIQIVKCIKKYPCLYDTQNCHIEDRNIVEKSWEKVAEELGVSEGYVKGRWTNIKGCFSRYLRNKTRNKHTKSYYLARYLDFLLPFTSAGRQYTQYQARRKPNVSQECSSADEGALVIDETPMEDNTVRDCPVEDNNTRKMHREFEVKVVDSDGEESYRISTVKAKEGNSISHEDNPDWCFLSSLLPDFYRMNGDQKAKFKSSLLACVDTVLYGEDIM